MQVTVDEFYDDDVQTSFVNRICAFLVTFCLLLLL